MHTKYPWILKASGQKEEFHFHKLRKSLERTKAPSQVIEQILDHIKHSLKPGMTTNEIYKQAHNLLKGYPASANKYSLKRTIMNMGPDGFPFEQLIARLYRALGYTTETNCIVKGNCVTHEVDIIAKNTEETIFIECKFHNLLGTKSDIKTVLYTHSRVEDIKDNLRFEKPDDKTIYRTGLITNTSLTGDAIQYGTCKNMHLLAWNYPPNEGLATLISRTKIL